MKVLVIPDVHGSHEWEKVKSIPKESYDFAIFLGDYFDSGKYDKRIRNFIDTNEWPDQGANFKNICEWVREDPEHRKMCLGNHDFSYISATRYGGNCSGHQNTKIPEIRLLLKENLDIIDLAQEIDGWVFSHGSFTKTWVSEMKHQLHNMLDKWPDEQKEDFEDEEEFEEYKKSALIWDESEWSIEFLNKEWHKLSHWPGDKNTEYGFDELLDWHGFYSGSGNEITQGPLWVRPEALLRDAYYPNNVVGHTEYGMLEPLKLQIDDIKLLCVDSPLHDNIFIFDTECKEENWQSNDEFNKSQKRLTHIINDAKSRQEDKEITLKYIKENLGFSDEKIKKVEYYYYD